MEEIYKKALLKLANISYGGYDNAIQALEKHAIVHNGSTIRLHDILKSANEVLVPLVNSPFSPVSNQPKKSPIRKIGKSLVEIFADEEKEERFKKRIAVLKKVSEKYPKIVKCLISNGGVTEGEIYAARKEPNFFYIHEDDIGIIDNSYSMNINGRPAFELIDDWDLGMPKKAAGINLLCIKGCSEGGITVGKIYTGSKVKAPGGIEYAIRNDSSMRVIRPSECFVDLLGYKQLECLEDYRVEGELGFKKGEKYWVQSFDKNLVLAFGNLKLFGKLQGFKLARKFFDQEGVDEEVAPDPIVENDQEATCIDNAGMEESFDLNITYLVDILHKDPDMIWVIDKQGTRVECFKNRFLVS
jgi:hypothetical protein